MKTASWGELAGLLGGFGVNWQGCQEACSLSLASGRDPEGDCVTGHQHAPLTPGLWVTASGPQTFTSSTTSKSQGVSYCVCGRYSRIWS